MKQIANTMEPAFLRELGAENTQVPDFLLDNYRELGLSDQELIALLRVLACRQKYQPVIDGERLLNKWRGNKAELSAALAALQRQGVLQLVDGGCTVEGLYAKMLELWVFQRSVPAACSAAVDESATAVQPELTEVIKTAYQLFEGEFARPLSPLEMEKLNAWLIADRWDFSMLKEAMRRAVLHNALNLAYIDKILLRWKSEGIASLEQLAAREGLNENFPAKAPAKKSRAKKPRAAEPSFVGESDYSKYF